jgi:hypothetical protein
MCTPVVLLSICTLLYLLCPQVDIFSLGVVVFEMWHPFSTAMERVVLLRELREAGKMPPAWEAAHPQVARLIRWVSVCLVRMLQD